MATPDPASAKVARAQIGELAPGTPVSATGEVNLSLILDVSVTLSLQVGTVQMTVRDLLQLAPGSIVELNRLSTEPLDVLANGVRIARGELVVVDEKFGIRLTDVVSAAERVQQVGG